MSIKKRKKYIKRLSLSLLIASGILGGGYIFLHRLFLGSNLTNKETIVLIPKNSTYKQLIDSIGQALVDRKSFEVAAKLLSLEKSYHCGRYKFVGRVGNFHIIRTIKQGLQTPVNLTLAGNIRKKEKLAAIVGERLEADSSAIANMLYNKEFTDSLGFDQYNSLSMYILNTYSIYWTTTPYNFALRMKKEYDNFWKGAREERAKKISLSPVEVIILASIVAEETNIKSEYPIIAGVYMNRLIKGKNLEADPTVKYALADPSIKRILYEHLEIESPYNTYKYSGLPPGPIVIPPIAAIDSVLNYTKHNYMFFCAKPEGDGSHVFANTFEEHSRNAQAYRNRKTILD